MNCAQVEATPHNHRIQAPAGGAAVLNCRVGHSPAAPDAERWAEPQGTVG